jgi:hypothetical protein
VGELEKRTDGKAMVYVMGVVLMVLVLLVCELY